MITIFIFETDNLTPGDGGTSVVLRNDISLTPEKLYLFNLNN
jgi:hypothetical protein